ncbi:Methyl binding domain protein [Datura stramonium]|uniref:Methyl binding domain protein n=1 Tax=Datura stramonium TaxID=4076 RepID=A0ABS8UVG6_DATST|nr:Methyl binding domain protein [Datura stramonium]
MWSFDSSNMFQTSDLRVQDGGKKLPGGPSRDLLHCDKCNVTFNDKDDLLQHQLSSHQRRRSRNGGQSITDGVIIKDGKFECQFCHKTFEEKHRYNGHVGNHVKNQGSVVSPNLTENAGVCVDDAEGTSKGCHNQEEKKNLNRKVYFVQVALLDSRCNASLLDEHNSLISAGQVHVPEDHWEETLMF